MIIMKIIMLFLIILFNKGVCYIRTSRQDNAIIYNSNEDFHVGQAKVSDYYLLLAKMNCSIGKHKKNIKHSNLK